MLFQSRSTPSRGNCGSMDRQSFLTGSSVARAVQENPTNPRNTYTSGASSFYGSSRSRSSSSTPAPFSDRTNMLQIRNSGDVARTIADEFESNSGQDFTNEFTWSPGDMYNWPQYHPYARGGGLDIFQKLEERIESKLNDFSVRLGNMETKIASLESIEHARLSSLSSSSSSESSSGHRKKRSPSDLQHKIRNVHACFNEENQLKCHERIDSEHNRKVVSDIIEELTSPQGSQQSGYRVYSSEQIRDGCRIYRKSLHEAEKEKSELHRKKMRVRSRQQRLFDRRNRAVNKEKFKTVQKYWADVTADMMTEEETGEENSYIRRRQSWRSANFNRLIDALDASCKSTKSVAKRREVGAPTTSSPPSTAKRWMISAHASQDEEEDDNDETFTSLIDSN